MTAHLEDSPDVTLPRGVVIILIEAANRQASLNALLAEAGEITLRPTVDGPSPNFQWAATTATAIIEGP